MDNILDHVVVQGQRYDIVSPTAFGDYIETIGSACINPDGYAQGSTFLAKFGNEQFYYEATAAITQGSAILEGTNCKKTTVTGREAELTSEIETLGETVDSLNEAFTNYINDYGSKNILNFEGTKTYSSGRNNNDILGNAVYLKAGEKIVFSCYQNETLSSITRNTLQIENVSTGTSIYESSDSNYHLSSGIHSMEYTVPSNGNYRFKIWCHTPDATVTYSKFMVCSKDIWDTDPTYQPYAMTNRELTENLTVQKTTATSDRVNIIGYDSTNNQYTCPCDGYVYVYAGAGTGFINVFLQTGGVARTVQETNHVVYDAIFVKKGTVVYVNTTQSTASEKSVLFAPLY